MKRFLLGLLTVGLLLAGSGKMAFATRSTDNFTITKFNAEYSLSRDSDNRSKLEATWRITANFPPNQNRGIAPVFVKKYDDHSTNFSLQSVTDENGTSLEYSWNDDELRIGNKNTYVKGEKTYIIKFTQRDVTKNYGDTGRDEFYWDVIGDEWRVPMENVQISVKLDESLSAARQGKAFCYVGSRGSTTQCDLSEDNGRIAAKIDKLSRRQGVTVAVGFKSGTFSEYQETLMEKLIGIWHLMQILAYTIATPLAIFLIIRYRRLVGREKELKPIPPEYLPPEDISVLMSTYVLKKYDLFKVKGLPKVAQLLDLAVRHYIKIYEVKKSSLFSGAQYEIEIIKDLQELKAEEIEIVQDMFDSSSIPKPGQRLNLKNLQNNIKYMTRTRDDDKNLETLAREKYGLCEQNPEVKRIMRGWFKRVLVLAILFLSPMFLVMSIMLVLASRGWSLTDKGLRLRRYLKGLKMYIGVAEAERLNILQSPEGAEKVVVDVNDGKQLVKLYERVLPYAVLFGQEKNWSKQMGKYYEQFGEAPDWYVGQGAFNAVAFSSGLSGLSTAAGHASDYSSTSGGSSGGGFAGGGGGGGGGGQKLFGKALLRGAEPGISVGT